MGVVIKGRSTGPKTTELVHESGSVVVTMAPKDNGGDGSTFSPTDLCAASLGACGCTIMRMFADNHGIPLAGISFELTKEMSPPPRKIARIVVAFKIEGELSAADFTKVVAAGKACPVRLTLGDGVEIVESYDRA
jgi:Predicted redox protein, regulator of disulfide bond formation